MFCTNCGSQVKDNFSFCPKCGAKTDDGEPVVPVQPQPGPSQNGSFYLTVRRIKVFGTGYVKTEITVNGMDWGALASGYAGSYPTGTGIAAVKIAPKYLFARPLELKLQLYSNAQLEFSIIDEGIGRFSKPEVLLERLTGAVILQ